MRRGAHGRLLHPPGTRRRVVEHKDGTTSEKPPYAASTRRIHRSIVSGVLQQAVFHKAIPSNPVRELERIESHEGNARPRGLTAEERRRLLAHVDADRTAVRADLPDLIRFALGSGLRVAEICAVRWMDLDLDGIPVTSAAASCTGAAVPLDAALP